MTANVHITYPTEIRMPNPASQFKRDIIQYCFPEFTYCDTCKYVGKAHTHFNGGRNYPSPTGGFCVVPNTLDWGNGSGWTTTAADHLFTTDNTTGTSLTFAGPPDGNVVGNL